MAKKSKEDKIQDKPRVHDELRGFDITINSFGEISSNVSMDTINQFLDKNVVDKKIDRRKTDDGDSQK